MDTKIVLISGKAQSGKDTFAKYFKIECNLYSKKCLIIKYGDILKFICKQYFYWNGEKDLEGRTLLQQVGTNLVRRNNENTWVNCIIELVKGLHTEYDYILIPDTRFPNEIKQWMGTDFDFVTVRMNRMNDENKEFDNKLTQEQKIHTSETALDSWVFDYNCFNRSIIDVQNFAQSLFKEMEEF